MKNNIRTLILCVCCALGGAAVDRALLRDGAAPAPGPFPGRPVADNGGGAGASEHGGEALFSHLESLKTPAQWRAYIGRWLALDCPRKDWRNVLECLRRWSGTDAEGALAFVHGAERFYQRNEAYALPLAALCAKDMARATGWLHGNLREDDRRTVAEITIMALKDEHPREAWALARTDGIPVDSGFLSAILNSMLGTSPADALAMLDSLPDDGKAGIAGAFATAWAGMDAKAALEWCATQKGKPFAGKAAMGLLEYLAEENPSEIGRVAERLGVMFDADRHDGFYGFMDTLACNDPLAALEVLQKMPVEQMRRYGELTVRELFRTDADQAISAAHVLLPGDESMRVICRSYREWAYSDRKAAEDWLAKNAEAGLRGQINMRQSALDDPAAFLAATGQAADPGGAFMSECLDDALAAMADKRAGEALRWLLANPAQITEKRMAWFSGENTGGEVPLAIGDIAGIPDAKARETLVEFAANESMRGRNWAEAAAFLPLVTDSARQDVLRYRIFSGMMAKASERDAARAWLATQPLSDEVRASWETLAGAAAPQNNGDAETDPYPAPAH